MWRTTSFLILLCLGSIQGQSSGWAQDDAELARVWAERLQRDTEQLFESGGLEPREKADLCWQVAYSLALVGHGEQAVSLAKEVDEAARATILVSVADAQSTRDDVEGAYRTADLLSNDGQVQSARRLIAIRQAQRGDFEDSIRLLARLSSPNDRDFARKYIIVELLESYRYRQAIAQYSRVNGKDQRESIRKEMERVRNPVEPSDPDYIENTVAKTRRLRTLFGSFSDDDAKFVRLESRARVAMHRKNEAAFQKAIDNARHLITDWDTGDRCSALLSLGTLCTEFGEDALAQELFRNAFDVLFELGKPDFGDSHYKVYFGLAAGERFKTIVKVMSDAELLRIGEQFASVGTHIDVLAALGRGLSANGRMDVAQEMIERLPTLADRVQFSAGVLVGLGRRLNRQASHEPSERESEEEQKASLAIIDRIIADKRPLKFVNTGTERPDREFLGLYNVSRASLPGYDGEIWQEAEQLPELTLEEFLEVRSAVVFALWGHGSVYGFPATQGDHDFLVWDDKFSDRTQKIEVRGADDLAEILPAAVAAVQQVLAKHPKWRVVVLGDGENAKDEYFVIYPDTIRILQASETNSMTEAIELNASSRSTE